MGAADQRAIDQALAWARACEAAALFSVDPLLGGVALTLGVETLMFGHGRHSVSSDDAAVVLELLVDDAAATGGARPARGHTSHEGFGRVAHALCGDATDDRDGGGGAAAQRGAGGGGGVC